MRLLLLSNHNFFVGREYMSALKNANISFDVALFGEYEDDYDEDPRCKGLWKPRKTEELLNGINCYRFKNVNHDDFIAFLKKNNYELGIQGGTSIIKAPTINLFRYGILNFHPGDLPKYRGCSCPEWQIFEGCKVVCTAHFITEGIDDGPILEKRILDLNYATYELMRSTIYVETSKFIVNVLQKIFAIDNFMEYLQKQNEEDAIYRKPIPDEYVDLMKTNWLDYASKLNKIAGNN